MNYPVELNPFTQCGLNADFSVQAWHVGPSNSPLHVAGDLYILDTESDSGEDEIRCSHCNALGKADELEECCAYQRDGCVGWFEHKPKTLYSVVRYFPQRDEAIIELKTSTNVAELVKFATDLLSVKWACDENFYFCCCQTCGASIVKSAIDDALYWMCDHGGYEPDDPAEHFETVISTKIDECITELWQIVHNKFPQVRRVESDDRIDGIAEDAIREFLLHNDYQRNW